MQAQFVQRSNANEIFKLQLMPKRSIHLQNDKQFHLLTQKSLAIVLCMILRKKNVVTWNLLINLETFQIQMETLNFCL